MAVSGITDVASTIEKVVSALTTEHLFKNPLLLQCLVYGIALAKYVQEWIVLI